MAYSSEGQRPDRDNLEKWEQDLIRSVVTTYRTVEREDLEAELAWRLLVLKRRRQPGIKNWRAYVFKFLRNKASNWIRKTRPRERKTVSLEAPIETGTGTDRTLVEALASLESDIDQRLAFERALDELPARLRHLLEILIEENWNQIAVAKRLRKHRNTIRSWIQQIQQKLIAHGFGPKSLTRKTVRKSRDGAEVAMPKQSRERRESIVVSWPLLEAMIRLRLSGAEWRLALWVIHQTSERRRRTVPFAWRTISEALNVDHAGLWRAGTRLLRARLLFIEHGRIGLQRSLKCWRLERRG